jgi:hypothetical protein
MGLAAAALALRALRFWQVALLGTSGLMAFSSIPSIVADLMHAPSFKAWFGLFQHVSATSVYYLLILPLYHVAIVAAVLVHVAFTLRARAHRQGNAA